MMGTVVERQNQIIQRLNEKGFININEIAEELNVSSMTIRRDLRSLEKDGILKIRSGGAILASNALLELSIEEKQTINQIEKQDIARVAASYIKKGTCFLDAGTTVAELAKFISVSPRKTATVFMTNSLLSANLLSQSGDFNLLMCPGQFRKTSMAFLGPVFDQFIQNYKIDLLFLGTEGIDAMFGLSVPDIDDASSKRTLINQAEEVILLADSSKFDKSFFCKIASLDRIDLIITDSGLNSKTKEKLEETGISVRIVERSKD